MNPAKSKSIGEMPMIENPSQRTTDTEKEHMEQTKYPCSKCSYVTNIKSMLNSHTKTVHEGGYKSYTCPECKTVFNNKGKFAAHLLSEHNIIYKY